MGKSVEIGLLIGSSEGEFTAAVYVRSGTSAGLNLGLGCRIGIGMVFDSIENAKGVNGCFLAETAAVGGTALKICGLPSPSLGFDETGLSLEFESGAFEASIAIVGGVRLALAYVKTQTYILPFT